MFYFRKGIIMAYNYPHIERNADKTYGPTSKEHFYLPVGYHNPTARKRTDKTRWCIKPPEQYEVFRVADEDSEHYQGDGGLYGFLDNMDEILGLDNEERIAYFPEPGNNPWHGYPVSSKDISNEVIKLWKETGFISTRDYRNLLKREI